ncbi:MAG TPA: Asp-tRNA(Asn)/Glu-tRNA(Gln) amidotransferase subunit GatC [Nitrososphaera sp.]|jgi:aspartyl-tRNA(Asn)/glutamyl-tRNA(Gln) amidotransferase subunit C
MAVTKDQVKHLGWLSRIELSDEELALYAGQIETIVKYLDKLDMVPLQEVRPVVTKKKFSDLRDDIAVEFGADLLPTLQRKEGFVKGPRMV